MPDGGIELAQTLPGQAEPASLAPGARAGQYEVVRLIGGGAMGDVYEGRHPVIGKRVAIKVVKHVLAANEESAQRFIREARAVNQIDHPNVIDVFAFGRLSDGRLYLVMDLLEGESLAERLNSRGAVDLDDFYRFMEPICSAVAGAHAAGVIHRDLKPANVFLAISGTGEEKVYVLDFGVAKLMDSAREEVGQTLTGRGVWIGTPAYMAPEQWTAEGASLRSDIYALGAMGYELLSGKSPFVADSIPGVMEKHFRAEIPTLPATSSIPSYLEDALRQAMAKSPDERFESAGQLMEGLRGKNQGQRRRRAWPKLPAVLGLLLLFSAVAALIVIKSTTGNGSAATRPAAAARGMVFRLGSRPEGALVERNGVVIGRTPVNLPVQPTTPFEAKVSKPGYSSDVLLVDSEGSRTVELVPISGFDGLWLIPSGELRRFERDDVRGRVNAYHRLDDVADRGEFLRFFEYVAATEPGVVFQGSDEWKDESLPKHASCYFMLSSQYNYRPKSREMKLRNEIVDVGVVDGRCVARSRTWSEFEPVRRVGDEQGDVVHGISRAGAGSVAPVGKANSKPRRAPAKKSKSASPSKKSKSPRRSKKERAAQFEGARPPIAPNLAPQQKAKKNLLEPAQQRRKGADPKQAK